MKTTCFSLAAFSCLAITLLAAGVNAQEAKPSPFAKWEKDIAALEKQDAPDAKHEIVFVGSSSIRLWKLDESFPGLKLLNRGFGGSELADSVHFAPRIVLKYEPKIVVLYAGDNDLANGKKPEQVAADFVAFEKVVHDKLPKTKIIYVAVKPSIARWKNIANVMATNKLIAAECAKDAERLVFLDIAPLMLGANGEPDPSLFVKDGLHLSPAGYAKWNEKLLPLLK